MSQEIEEQLEKIPVVRNIAKYFKTIELPGLEGLTLYELLEIYILGIIENTVTYKAGSIAFSFFMALFPFALFILNLIPFIPIEGFQQDFLKFVEESVPPNTYGAIESIVNDILNNSYQGLLSTGFLLSIFLMANGLNSILGGFETSQHVIIKRGFFRQYFIAVGMSLLISLILIVTVAAIVIFEVFIRSIHLQDVIQVNIDLIVIVRYVFVILMLLITTSILFKFGTTRTGKRSFISVGSVFTTVLVIITSYVFAAWVIGFSQYNELYGSIGTLLVVMFYIWINCMILLLGFELNAAINTAKRKKLFT